MFDRKLFGVYSQHSIALMQQFEQLVQRECELAMVFVNSAAAWTDWESPWIFRPGTPDNDFIKWATAPDTKRQLAVTLQPFPAVENLGPWLSDGASGAFAPHATKLGTNLVAKGVGNAVIRIAHEANNPGNPYSIASTWSAAQFAQWKQMWLTIGQALKAVPGSNFTLDWCINAYYAPIPMDNWYPGDSVVDIIGIDAYDGGVPAGQDPWTRVYTQDNGIKQVLEYSAAHGKPTSFPEWGLWSDGDNPNYINGMGSVVRDNPIAYTSYFYKSNAQTLLTAGSQSLAAFKEQFSA